VEPWKLICHHTYAGTPGVVYDVSPDHQNHAGVVDIHDADFLREGAGDGSGSVRLRTQNARIGIPRNPSWQPLDAMRGEVTVLLETPQPAWASVSRLLDADSFRLDVRSGGLVAWFRGHPARHAEVSTHSDGLDPTFQLPLDRWITVGFLHDGVGLMELSVDGEAVARRTASLWPLAAPGDISLGNARTGGLAMFGLLDDVKIWRLQPDLIEERFADRPLDTATAECWARYRSDLREWARLNPECGRELHDLGDAVLESLRRDAFGLSEADRAHLAAAAGAYREFWRSGRLDGEEMAAVLADVTALLSGAGVSPEANPELQRMAESDCLRRLRSEVPVPDCDPQLTAMFARR
jgi:hypothetical protein